LPIRFSVRRDSKARDLPFMLLPASVVHPLQGQTLASRHLPGCGLKGRNFRLELYNDPPRLPRVVPAVPDFSSRPRKGFPFRVQPTCQGQVRRLPAAPAGDFHPFPPNRTSPVSAHLRFPRWIRFRVAQSHTFTVRGLGRTGHCSPERPSQPYERNYPHTATAYARRRLVVFAWSDWWSDLSLAAQYRGVGGR
jgi:hypothetical protein